MEIEDERAKSLAERLKRRSCRRTPSSSGTADGIVTAGASSIAKSESYLRTAAQPKPRCHERVAACAAGTKQVLSILPNRANSSRSAAGEESCNKGEADVNNMALRLVGKDEGDKQRALEAALTQIDRAFGKGSVMKLGERGRVEMDSIHTGSLGLDIALGIGGLPKGRVIEIYGPESSGKTTLALHVVAESQRAGGVAAFVDAEHALDPTYAHKLGVNLDDLLVAQPDTGEQALEITDTLVRSGAVDVIVVDSVAALTPRAEIEGEMGDSLPGLQARLMS